MRITRDDGQVTLRDGATSHWFLGLFLLAGGLLCIAAPLGLANDSDRLQRWGRVASIAVGLGVSTGALWWLRRSPATRIVLEPGRRRMQLIRLGLTGRKVEECAPQERDYPPSVGALESRCQGSGRGRRGSSPRLRFSATRTFTIAEGELMKRSWFLLNLVASKTNGRTA